MLGDNIIYQICYMCNFMPAVVLTSKICPENMEVHKRTSVVFCFDFYDINASKLLTASTVCLVDALQATVYALLSGFQNFGQQVAVRFIFGFQCQYCSASLQHHVAL